MEDKKNNETDDMSLEDIKNGFEEIIKNCEQMQDERKRKLEEIKEMRKQLDETVKKFGGEENYSNAVNNFLGKLASGEIKVKIVSDAEMEESRKVR